MGLSVSSVLHLEDEMTGEVIRILRFICLSEQRIISPKTENVLIDRSGQRHSIQGTAAPMIDAQGKIIGVVLVVKMLLIRGAEKRKWYIRRRMIHSLVW